MKPIIMGGDFEISDTGMVPRGLRIFSLAADRIPAEMRTIPATEAKAQSNGAGHRPAVNLAAASGASQGPAATPALANDPLAGMTAKQIFFDCVWLSEESTATKIMLLCIGRFFDENARSSSMSYAQVARECGLHEVTTKKIANAVRDRWLRIGVGKGFYVPGKGAQNLYHGACPPELVERLREERRKGRVVPRDAEIEKAAAAAVDRVKSGVVSDCTGVASDYPEAQNGVASDYPEEDRGSLRFGPGLPQATRTQIDADKEKDSGADAPGAGATENLFSGGAPDDAGAPPERSPPEARRGTCKPSSPEPDDEAPAVEMSPACWQALAAYNEAAAQHKFTPCERPTEDQAKRLAKRIKAVGGLGRFKRALGALPLDDFLIGRLPGKNGGKPFKLSIDRLMQTEGKMGDVLGRLLGLADEADAANAPDAAADLEAEVERMLAGPDGQRLVQDKGPDEARRIISDIVNGKGAPHA